jgi:hypothetical protein
MLLTTRIARLTDAAFHAERLACAHVWFATNSSAGASKRWRLPPWHSDSPAAGPCRTKGSVRLRAIAGGPALLDRTKRERVVDAVHTAALVLAEQRKPG